jgi:hypothetical protein
VGVLAAGVFLAAGATVAAAAPTKNLPSTTYEDKRNGYRITVPTKWQVVPPSQKFITAKVAQLKKQHKTQLAQAWAAFVNTANGRAELKSFTFRAFMWPALPSPIPTDVSVRWDKIAARYKVKDLPAIAGTYVRELRSSGNAVANPKLIRLPAGQAIRITGTAPLPQSNAKTAFTIVLFVRPGRLYSLSFRIDSRAAKDANIFTSIADHFRFV